jgi:hypothetical protein
VDPHELSSNPCIYMAVLYQRAVLRRLYWACLESRAKGKVRVLVGLWIVSRSVSNMEKRTTIEELERTKVERVVGICVRSRLPCIFHIRSHREVLFSLLRFFHWQPVAKAVAVLSRLKSSGITLSYLSG